MIDIILLIILIILIFIFFKSNNNNRLYIKSNNGVFIINKDLDKNIKSILLSKIINNMYLLKKYLINNIDNFKEYYEYITLLDKNFTEKRTYIYETDSNSSYTSYSVNKGEELKKIIYYIILIY